MTENLKVSPKILHIAINVYFYLGMAFLLVIGGICVWTYFMFQPFTSGRFGSGDFTGILLTGIILIIMPLILIIVAESKSRKAEVVRGVTEELLGDPSKK